jgi:hypothetical protein
MPIDQRPTHPSRRAWAGPAQVAAAANARRWRALPASPYWRPDTQSQADELG